MSEATGRLKQLPTEALMRLFINGQFLTHLLCTPYNLKELAIGWLLGQRIIRKYEDILSLAVCDEMAEMVAHIKSDSVNLSERFKPIMASGCGSGQINSAHYLENLEVVNSDLIVDVAQCRLALSAMFTQLSNSSAGPGIHCAAIVDPNDETELIFSYDIGRHNAVDKVIGAALLRSYDLHSKILATSGRISSDMVVKAATAGIPVLVSPRSVTTLAAELAEKAGIGVVGRLGKTDVVIVGNESRIRGRECRES